MREHNGIVVIGAGGHARVIISTLRAARQRIAGVYDDDESRWGQNMMGFKVQGPISQLRDYPGPAVVGVGNGDLRQTIVNRLNLKWTALIHPSAAVHPAVRIGQGAVIFAGSVVQPEAVIGEHVIINTGACVDHNCELGDYVQIAPNATLCGNVTVGAGTFVGAGAVVLENLVIGNWSIIGGGATVIRDLPGHVTAVGCPSKIIKQHGENELA